MKLLKKKDEDDFMTVQPKKKGGKGKGAAAAAAPSAEPAATKAAEPAKKKLNHTLEALKTFMQFNIEVPQTTAELSATIEKVRQGVSLYGQSLPQPETRVWGILQHIAACAAARLYVCRTVICCACWWWPVWVRKQGCLRIGVCVCVCVCVSCLQALAKKEYYLELRRTGKKHVPAPAKAPKVADAPAGEPSTSGSAAAPAEAATSNGSAAAQAEAPATKEPVAASPAKKSAAPTEGTRSTGIQVPCELCIGHAAR